MGCFSLERLFFPFFFFFFSINPIPLSSYLTFINSSLRPKSYTHQPYTMTRTTRTYSNASDNEPRYFAKAGHSDQNPNEIKKNGHGRLNWGTASDEIDDVAMSGEFNFANPRRRSNSTSMTRMAKDIRPPQFESTMVEEAEEIDRAAAAARKADAAAAAAAAADKASDEE